MKGSPCFTATTPACCAKVAADAVLNSFIFSSVGIMPGGAVIQPMRQPVMLQDLEKLFSTSTGSSSPAISRKEGARVPSNTMRS